MEENKTDELLAQGGEASESVTQTDGMSAAVQSGGTLEGAASENTQSGASENTQGSEIRSGVEIPFSRSFAASSTARV